MLRDGVFYIRGLERMSEEEFFRFCQVNRDLRFERNGSGEILLMPLRGAYSGLRGARISAALYAWNEASGRGVVFSASAGFTLPDGSVRSPQSSWVPRAVWEALSVEEQQRFAPVCPAFVVELKSSSDSVRVLKEKMEVWMANGCRLGWLIDPAAEQVFVYRADGSREEIEGFDASVSGEGVLPGFALELKALR